MEIVSLVTITPLSGKRQEVLAILRSVKGPTQALHGCLACLVGEEEGDERLVFCLERWRSREDLLRHLRSPLYTRTLAALELSREAPGVFFFEIAACEGMALIESVRHRDAQGNSRDRLTE